MFAIRYTEPLSFTMSRISRSAAISSVLSKNLISPVRLAYPRNRQFRNSRFLTVKVKRIFRTTKSFIRIFVSALKTIQSIFR